LIFRCGTVATNVFTERRKMNTETAAQLHDIVRVFAGADGLFGIGQIVGISINCASAPEYLVRMLDESYLTVVGDDSFEKLTVQSLYADLERHGEDLD